MEIKEVFDVINKQVEPILKESGFKTLQPDGIKANELPLKVTDEFYEIAYQSDKYGVAVRWDPTTKKMTLNCSELVDAKDGVYGEISLWLFDEERNDDRDAKSIANDFEDSLTERFGSNARHKDIKMPETVSRTAVRNGSSEYDAKTLATRIAVIYPELKDVVKENVMQYGDFLPEEFFSQSAAPKIIDTIRSGNKQAIKKIFNCLNEIYEDGNNEVQGIVAVTILGSMNNDPKLMEQAKEFMSENLRGPVLSVNKILGGRRGGKYKKKLENPPAVKEKKKLIRFVD